MLPPNEPRKEDCCGSGCNPCIFDVYEKKLKLYENFLESGIAADDSKENVISQLVYSDFSVVQNIQISAVHRLVTFQLSKEDARGKIWWNPGDHFLVKCSYKKKSCTRAYTPLPNKSCVKDYCSEDYDFAIIFKVYNGGLGSNYLCNLKPGEQTFWRGPYGSYSLKTNKERITMIAQGTSIVTFITIIENILGNEDDMTRINLYYCCSSEDSILLRDQLYKFKSYWNFQYQIFCSKASKEFKSKYQEPVVHHKLHTEDFESLEPFSEKDQFLLCGSSQFMKDFEMLLQKKFGGSLDIITF